MNCVLQYWYSCMWKKYRIYCKCCNKYMSVLYFTYVEDRKVIRIIVLLIKKLKFLKSSITPLAVAKDR